MKNCVYVAFFTDFCAFDVQNFNPNPFFEDTKLTKTFLFSNEGTTKITGTTIKWKEGKDLANGVNHDKKGSKRPFFDESFLNWFSETQEKDLAEGFHDEIARILSGWIGLMSDAKIAKSSSAKKSFDECHYLQES
ncbi:hypothetical protein Sjap_017866 [Stephania japonica]|uniref:Uncharacterized protein n=1 Tax=Stephania japonica TaxID=461633 RepID=A0AAP0I6X8_9MAGN